MLTTGRFAISVSPRMLPTRPVIGNASSGAPRGAVTATARWSAPASNGGAPVDGYVVTALRMDGNGTVLSRTSSPLLPGNTRSRSMTLRPGRYRFVVAARNVAGFSGNSRRSNTVIAQ